MAKEHIYKKDYEVRFFDCTPQKAARLSTVMHVMGDVAGLDYTERGYGHDELWDKGMVFLLSRVSIHFERMPHADEKIAFTTWEHGIEGPLFYRYFELIDESGAVIADADTAWILVDPVSRKILRPSVFYGEYIIVAEKLIKAPKPTRIRLSDQAVLCGERPVYYSDLDENGHMNNARYADIVFDFLNEEQRKSEISEFMINFNHEALMEDVLEIKADINDKTAVVGADFKSRKDNCFTAKVTFK